MYQPSELLARPRYKRMIDMSFNSQTFINNLTTQAGIYQMMDARGKVLYVGKARNLKKRLTSYFQKKTEPSKTHYLMQQVANIEVTVTRNENEALLLENNLIKQLRPRYNVLLRDDKSYPYIYCSDQDDYPRLDFYRGSKKEKGCYFGPYPSAGAVRETLNLLQKIFRIRSCKDSFFRNRSRPCLQYQIQRCSAPCVKYIDKECYQQSIRHALLFLEGKSQQIITELTKKMDAASKNLDFEQAAKIRDQIKGLNKIQEQQFITKSKGDIDVIAMAKQHGCVCVLVLYIRGGRVIGSRSHFPKVPDNANEGEVMSAFISQYYLSTHHVGQIPKTVITNLKLEDKQWLESFLSEHKGRKVEIRFNVRGERAQWLKMAMSNVDVALKGYVSSKMGIVQKLFALQKAFDLETLPQRLECFDISHTFGEETVASCVVFDRNGPLKNDYRRFNIKNITKSDDYGAMRQALTRHFTPLKKDEAKLPDILFIDGGKGQVSVAQTVFEQLQLKGVRIIGVAKGPARKSGEETLILANHKQGLKLPSDSPALHLIQQIRDEAHRFAITGHRKRRGKHAYVSTLEGIAGIGRTRRHALLTQLGGLQEIKRADVDQLAQVKGISKSLAEKIYQQLHN